MKIQVFPLEWEGRKRIGIRPMGYDKAFPGMMKQIEGGRWTPDVRCWHIPYESVAYGQLKRLFGEGQVIAVPERPANKKEEIRGDGRKTDLLTYKDQLIRLEERLRLQRYSHNTVKTYRNFFAQFLAYYPDQDPQTLEKAHIERFLLESSAQKKWSDSTQNQAVNAIKFYYEKILGQQRTYYELRPRRGFSLPGVFSGQEVKQLFEAVSNLKHRCILMLIYSAGLRIGESIRLRKEDVNFNRNTVFIKGGKGKKDRTSVLSEKMKDIVNGYLKDYRPQYWLFEGQGGGQYSTRSIQNVFRRAVKKSGVNPFTFVRKRTLKYGDYGVILKELDKNGQSQEKYAWNRFGAMIEWEKFLFLLPAKKKADEIGKANLLEFRDFAKSKLIYRSISSYKEII